MQCFLKLLLSNDSANVCFKPKSSVHTGASAATARCCLGFCVITGTNIRECVPRVYLQSWHIKNAGHSNRGADVREDEQDTENA